MSSLGLVETLRWLSHSGQEEPRSVGKNSGAPSAPLGDDFFQELRGCLWPLYEY